MKTFSLCGFQPKHLSHQSQKSLGQKGFSIIYGHKKSAYPLDMRFLVINRWSGLVDEDHFQQQQYRDDPNTFANFAGLTAHGFRSCIGNEA
jgi:hypothetical protein